MFIFSINSILRDLDDTEFFLLMNETNDLRNNTPDARTHHHISPVKCEKKNIDSVMKIRNQ